MSHSSSGAIQSWGLFLPPIAGVEVSAYVDRSATGFNSGLFWRDRRGSLWIGGCDLGRQRLRMVLQRLSATTRSL
jgi:hypothetical protein